MRIGGLTIDASTYLILHSHSLYARLAPFLGLFESPHPYQELSEEERELPELDVLVFGLGRYGGDIARELTARGVRMVAVDFDPQAVGDARAAGITALYGDAEDPDFLATLPLDQARWVLSTVPVLEGNLALLRLLRELSFKGHVAVRSHNAAETAELTAAGADLVLNLFEDAAREAAFELDRAICGETGAPEPRH